MRTIFRPFTVSCLATLLAASGGAVAQTVAIDNDDIGGTVNGRSLVRGVLSNPRTSVACRR